MRYGMYSPMFVANENGEFFCCHLPADFCAEHEWGIRDIARTFGLPQHEKDEGPLDVSRFQIQEVPQPEDGLLLKMDKEHHFLVLDSWEPERQTDHEHWLSPEVSKEKFNEEAVSILPVKASGKWDSKGFAIYVKGKDVGKYLQELHKAILDKDFAIMLGRGHAFQNGGLNLTIISKMPKTIKDTIAEELKDSRELNKAANATGIYQKISKDKYYALSPRWKDEEKKEVVFWLNPADQKNNECGWYSVADLELWLKGKGPIPKKD